MACHQVLVIGDGLAGLRATIEVKEKRLDVALLSQIYPFRSHSTAAQGGINASLANIEAGKDDNWKKHASDTIIGSDFLADQDAMETQEGAGEGLVPPMDRLHGEEGGLNSTQLPSLVSR